MAVYLLHFDEAFQHARHYVGWANDLERRLAHHGTERGANLLRHVRAAGIDWTCVRVWPDGDRLFERRLKAHSGTRYCPVCNPVALQHGAWLPSEIRGANDARV